MASRSNESSLPLLSDTHSVLASSSTPTTENEIERSSRNECSPIVFNYDGRRFRDLPFLFLFLLFVLCTLGLGVFCIVNHDSNYGNGDLFVFDKETSSCVPNSTLLGDRGRWSWLNASKMKNKRKGKPFAKDLVFTLVITLVLSIPFLLILLLLLKNYAKQIVYASLPLFVIIPLSGNVFWFSSCTVSKNCRDSLPLVYRIFLLSFIFLAIVIFAWIIIANWRRIGLTVRILAISAHALERNLGLLVVLPLLVAALLLYFVPIVVFLNFARFNGKIEPRLKGVGYDEYLCVWKQHRWVPAYYVLAILTMFWSLAVMIEAQAYIISGTVARWYFSKNDSMMRGRIRSSFRNAFGPSFGTVCFSGLLIGVVRLVRAAVDSARQEDTVGISNLVLSCCVNTLLSAIHFLNKFTINFVAITGEGYCPASKMTYQLLRRHFLSVAFVETISTRILVGITFVISAIYAIAVIEILRAVSGLEADVYFIAALAWLLLFAVFCFFIHVLNNVVDTMYICFAIDRDRGDVCKREVHEVYDLLPLSRSGGLSLATRSLP